MNLDSRKIIIMMLFILLGISFSLAQQKNKSFNLGSNGRIEVEISYGDINLDVWSKQEVNVKYEEDEETGSSFKMIQNGNTLTITSGENPSDDLSLSVPASINLDLNTSGGDIKINGNITGKIECRTAGGDIKTKDVTGTADINTSGGEITTGNINGDANINSGGGDLKLGLITGTADLSTGGGNITVSDVKKGLVIRTGGGNVNAGNVDGELKVTTGGGNVDVLQVKGSTKVTTGGGNITLKSSSGKNNFTTGGGDLILKDVNGGIKCYTGSGDIHVELIPDPKINSEIKSGMGDITLYIPSNARTTIVAKVRDWNSWGNDSGSPITSDFPVTTEIKTSHTLRSVYTINGGGSEIKIETSSGEIKIQKMK